MKTDLPGSLADRFIRWCRGCHGPEEEAKKIWSALSAHYCEPHRHYHNLDHIAASLAELDATGATKPHLEGAIWFHDVIYDPVRADNEAASIEWFEQATAAWLSPVDRAAIAALIAATDFRRPRTDDPEESLMVDIDLAILSADPASYDAYRSAVRCEYAHVPDEAFRAGRAKVMASFLATPIYRTAHFVLRETKARENIARELVFLGSKVPVDT